MVVMVVKKIEKVLEKVLKKYWINNCIEYKRKMDDNLIDIMDKLLLYSVQCDPDIMTKLKLNNLPALKIMRNNFGRFWNILSKKQKIKYVELSTEQKDIDYILVDKIICYACEVSRFDFITDYMGLTISSDPYCSANINSNPDDKDEFNKLKHNILQFWIGLTFAKKRKIIGIIHDYWIKNVYAEYIDCPRIKYITIKTDDDRREININRFNFNKNARLICEDELLDNIDLLCTDKLKYINCSDNKITKLDDLPVGLIVLVCNFNRIKSLDNLPNGLKCLSCVDNKIKQIDNLPPNLEVLLCDYNEITSFDNLPASLKYLVCDYNKVKQLLKLPKGLLYLSCGFNTIEQIEIPPYLKELYCKNISDYDNDIIGSIVINEYPTMLETLVLDDVAQKSIKWKFPYGLINLQCGKIKYDGEVDLLDYSECRNIPNSVQKINDTDLYDCYAIY